MSEAVDSARAELIAAIVRAGSLIIASLDGMTAESRAAIDAAMEEAKFQGIVLNELLIEEGNFSQN